jgi:hypothetical protein
MQKFWVNRMNRTGRNRDLACARDLAGGGCDNVMILEDKIGTIPVAPRGLLTVQDECNYWPIRVADIRERIEGLQAQKTPLSHYPLTRPLQALESGFRKGGSTSD